MVILIFIMSSIDAKRKKLVRQSFRTELMHKADSLFITGLTFIRVSQLDSASLIFSRVTDIRDADWIPSIADSARKLQDEIKEFITKRSEEYIRRCLMTMNQDSYNALLKNKLDTCYFTNPILNKVFIDLLYANHQKRSEYIAEEKERQMKLDKQTRDQEAQWRRAQVEADSKARKEYGEEGLREKYLDQGLDIKVSVYGKSNTIIKLTYVLFDDVWTHQMRKGTLIDEIRGMGFKKLILSDGYDYEVYWDF